MLNNNFDKENLLYFTLAQRSIICEFRKQTGINRSGVEIMAFASNQLIFTIYDLLKSYNQMNVQQLRKCVKRLVALNMLECVGTGKRGKAQVYMLSLHGVDCFENYVSLWAARF
jgi:hypothetical protein